MEDIVCSFSAVEWMDVSLMAMTSKMLEGMPGKRLKHIWDIKTVADNSYACIGAECGNSRSSHNADPRFHGTIEYAEGVPLQALPDRRAEADDEPHHRLLPLHV